MLLITAKMEAGTSRGHVSLSRWEKRGEGEGCFKSNSDRRSAGSAHVKRWRVSLRRHSHSGVVALSWTVTERLRSAASPAPRSAKGPFTKTLVLAK